MTRTRFGGRVLARRVFVPSAALALLLPAVAMAQSDPAASVLPAGTVPLGVTVEGIEISGLPALDARQRLYDQLVALRRSPMPVTFRTKQLTIDPDAVGYQADVDATIITAFQQAPPPGTTIDVPLVERIDTAKLATVLTWRGAQVRTSGRDAALSLRGLIPIVRKPVLGYSINVAESTAYLAPAFLAARPATPYALVVTAVRPAVTSVGVIIVVSQSEFKLRLWKGTKRIRTYPIAVGQSAYPTPTGNYQVIDKQMNPTWFPPDSVWAAGLGPVPPGVSNPLGTRWIGTSAPAIGMHGTPDPSSIRSAVSHGCIRMYIVDVEDLYSRVQLGTRVYIR
ncbi:MAG: L,D-transpeptidase [Thermoleophilia bacterium]|nr:L,D-transpeptidase [Thermoleophilia bacterium]